MEAVCLISADPLNKSHFGILSDRLIYSPFAMCCFRSLCLIFSRSGDRSVERLFHHSIRHKSGQSQRDDISFRHGRLRS